MELGLSFPFSHRRHIFARRTVHYRARSSERSEGGEGGLFLLSTARLEIPNLLAIGWGQSVRSTSFPNSIPPSIA